MGFNFDVEGRCPFCINHRKMLGSSSARGYKSLTCEGKDYTFPNSNLWYCCYHGYLEWKGDRHVLFDFVKDMGRAEVQPLPEGVPSPTLEDYMIVEMKCPDPECLYEWKQYDKTQLYDDRYVICPKCGAKILKEEAIKDKKLYDKKKELLNELRKDKDELRRLKKEWNEIKSKGDPEGNMTSVKDEKEQIDEVTLKVEDAKQRDVARGIARIDQKSMEKLNVLNGNVIEILGGLRRTSAIAWPAYSEDQDRGIIRLDFVTRENSGILIDDYVIIRKAEVKDAINVTLAPLDMRLNVDEDFTNFVKNRFMERTFIEGDTTLVMMLGHPTRFKVTNTWPHGIVRITDYTKLLILTEPNPKAEPSSFIQIELKSIEEINELNIQIEVLEKTYNIADKFVNLRIEIAVGFRHSVQTLVFATTFINGSPNLSAFLDDCRHRASAELEKIKSDITKRCEQVGYPININLYDAAKLIADTIGLRG